MLGAVNQIKAEQTRIAQQTIKRSKQVDVAEETQEETLEKRS